MLKKISAPPAHLIVLLLLLTVQLAIFSPVVGRGFVTDDFTWLENVVPAGKIDLWNTFRNTTGFFRPLVGASFAWQFYLHGLDPRPFGLFNLVLHLFNIILLYLLLSHWRQTRPFAAWTAVLFAMNSRAVIMAAGWISARTTLLCCFFILLALYSYLKLPHRQPLRYILTATFFLAALLSKESAAAAPVFIFLFAFLGFDQERNPGMPGAFRERVKSGVSAIIVFIPPLAVYSWLRFNSNAMTPVNAPDYYRYTLSPPAILKNLVEYFTRAGLLDLYIIIVLLAILAVSAMLKRKKETAYEKMTPDYRPAAAGLLWFAIFLLPVLPVPARSDLYVYFPQVGLHIAALTIMLPLWKKTVQVKGCQRYIAWLLVGILACAWTAYFFQGAARTAEKGKASARFTGAVVVSLFDIPAGSRIIIIDTHYKEQYSPSRVVAYGFPALLNLYYPEKKLQGELLPPPITAEITTTKGNFVFSWQQGTLQRIQ